MLIILAVPAGMDTEGLVLTLQALQIGADRYKVLLTKVPPAPEPENPNCGRSWLARRSRFFRPIFPS